MFFIYPTHLFLSQSNIYWLSGSLPSEHAVKLAKELDLHLHGVAAPIVHLSLHSLHEVTNSALVFPLLDYIQHNVITHHGPTLTIGSLQKGVHGLPTSA